MMLIAHGGAGEGRPSKRQLCKLREAIEEGWRALVKAERAVEAVMETIAALEDSGLFNAGAGANLQLDGIRRLDASIMEGRGLGAGSVAGLEKIKNPIRAARLVMDSPHRILTDIGARRLAEKENLGPLPPPAGKALERFNKAKEKNGAAQEFYKRYFSTVGAVALDKYGDVAAGSSTGGVLAMVPGRIGDTPIIGAGVYAENAGGAVSCTGRGEDIIRLSLAKEICMNLKAKTPAAASRHSLKRLLKIGGDAGVIVLDKGGRFAIMHTTPHMTSGLAAKDGIVVKDGFSIVA